MSRCPSCNASFSCGVADGHRDGTPVACWCMALPRLPSAAMRDAMDTTRRCLCPDCLRARQQALRAPRSGD